MDTTAHRHALNPWLVIALTALGSCRPPSEPVGMADTGAVEGSSGLADSSGSEGMASGSADSTSGDAEDTGTTGDPGVIPCPEEAGWQWIAREATDWTQGVEAVEGGVVLLGDVDADPVHSVLQHYDTLGQLQWEQGVEGEFFAEDLVAVPGGGLLVCGRGFAGEPSLWLSHHDASGMQQWSIDEPDIDCRGVGVTASGEIVVGGHGAGNEAVLYRFDDEGVEIGSWSAQLDLTFGIDRVVADGDDVLMIGESFTNSGFWLGRLDADNQLMWGEYHFVTEGFPSRATHLAVDPASGDILVVGLQDPDFEGWNDLAVWRFAADGTLVWQATHDFAGESEEGYGVQIAADGTIVVTGFFAVDGAYTAVVAGLTPDGDLQWSSEIDGGSPIFGLDLSIDACGAVYVAGYERVDFEDHGWVGRYVPER